MAMKRSAIYERELAFRSPDFPLDVSTWKNHPDYPVVRHDFCEIAIVLSGTAFKQVAGHDYPVKAGNVFALRGGTPHGYRNTRNLEVINVVYDPKVLENMKFDLDGLPGYQDLFFTGGGGSEPGGYRVMNMDMAQLSEIKKLAQTIESELHSGSGRRRAVRYQDRRLTAASKSPPVPADRACQFMAIAHFMHLLGLLSRWRFHKPTLVSEKIMNIERALDHMERHLDEPLDPVELARFVGMSYRNFVRIFQQVTGTIPSAHLQKIRLNKAADLLTSTDKSVTEIAMECGFTDSSYFSRCFGRQFGVTPRDFRARPTNIG